MHKGEICGLCNFLGMDNDDETMSKCVTYAMESIKRHFHDVHKRNKLLAYQVDVLEQGVRYPNGQVMPRASEAVSNVNSIGATFTRNYDRPTSTSVSGAYACLGVNGIPTSTRSAEIAISGIPEANPTDLSYRKSLYNVDGIVSYAYTTAANGDNINRNLPGGNVEAGNRETNSTTYFKMQGIYNYYSDAIQKIRNEYNKQMKAICNENACNPRDVPYISGGLEGVGGGVITAQAPAPAAPMRNLIETPLLVANEPAARMSVPFVNSNIDNLPKITSITSQSVVCGGSGQTYIRTPEPNMHELRSSTPKHPKAKIQKFLFVDEPCGNLLKAPKNPLFPTFETYVGGLDDVRLLDEENIIKAEPLPSDGFEVDEANGNDVNNMFINNKPQFDGGLGDVHAPLTKRYRSTTTEDEAAGTITTSEDLKFKNLYYFKRKRMENMAANERDKQLAPEPISNTPIGYWNPLMNTMTESVPLPNDQNDQNTQADDGKLSLNNI